MQRFEIACTCLPRSAYNCVYKDKRKASVLGKVPSGAQTKLEEVNNIATIFKFAS
jgi:hypothetical protein